ncbi:multidrug effflux MFS transporter [Fulvivirgaceae bacterium BMA12]|uniref:Multidrug effflux MFS transporter n=1 Tax=Agaribacillus aureus TaxID=3051825 RepID=A0ABT8LFM7_9BACT|nr:multidrug effflux MFS transporter [Fulvivirgaceae bacterium BMA12]
MMAEVVKKPIKKKNLSELEFIALMAFLMSNVALSIDAVLPGLKAIGLSIHNTNSADLQLIITMIFLGLGIGELIFGTLSDSFGRKPVVYHGLVVFIMASILCVTASSLQTMLVGRIMQGIGLSAPRTISIAIIRDTYNGNYMARIMSFITAIFILVPMIAPIAGQLILNHFDWQAIFYFQLMFAIITIVWFGSRQRETLPKEKRVKFAKTLFRDGLKEFFKFRPTIIYTLVSGLMEGAFILYLSTSRQIFQDQYHLLETFPYVFAAISFVLGVATFFNGSLVLRYGMRKLVVWALYLFCFSSLIYLFLFFRSGNPRLMILLLFLFLQFLSLGFIFGNLSALAMRPIGHIAGIGAAVFTVLSTVVAVPVALLIGPHIITSVVPLFAGFLCCGLCALLLLRLSTPGKKEITLSS